jgi:hypothetical protein
MVRSLAGADVDVRHRYLSNPTNSDPIERKK